MTISDGEPQLRPLQDGDWPAVLAIYAEGIATGNATFETETPSRDVLDGKWLPAHRWVATIDDAATAVATTAGAAAVSAAAVSAAADGALADSAAAEGAVAGWAALTPVSARECYAGVAETSVYVGAAARGRGVGKALVRHQIAAAEEAGLWTLQTSVFPENEASVALHVSLGFRIVGRRERIAQHRGTWRDTLLLERRA